MQHAIEKIATRLAPFKRTTYVPILARDHDTPYCSKFYGFADIIDMNELPVMKTGLETGELAVIPYRQVLQINHADLPEKFASLVSWKTFQFFYDVDDNGTFDFANNSRFILRNELPASSQPYHYNDERVCQRITGWQTYDDYPHREDYAELNIQLTKEEKILFETVSCCGIIQDMLASKEYAEAEIARANSVLAKYGMAGYENFDQFKQVLHLSSPVTGDKLGGWPRWEQGAEWPNNHIDDSMFFQFCAWDRAEDYRAAAVAGDFFAADGFGHIWYSENQAPTFTFACG